MKFQTWKKPQKSFNALALTQFYIESWQEKFPSGCLVVVQSLSCVRLFVTLRTAACQASLSLTSPGACFWVPYMSTIVAVGLPRLPMRLLFQTLSHICMAEYAPGAVLYLHISFNLHNIIRDGSRLVATSCPTLQTPWPVARQASSVWDFPGHRIGASCHSLLQRIFPTRGLNPSPLHCQANFLPPSHQRSIIQGGDYY